MGHAGAIVSGADESAEAKMRVLSECGIHVVDSPAEIGLTMKNVLESDCIIVIYIDIQKKRLR